jgi:hypothetical protein
VTRTYTDLEEILGSCPCCVSLLAVFSFVGSLHDELFF